jgi:hypothetical protein
MIAFLIILILFLVVSTTFFAFQAYRLGKVVLGVQDAIEESLDVLDERFKSMSEILEKPVFFDSIEIRQVIEEIRISRDAVLYVANQLTIKQELEADDKKDSQD